MDTKYRIKIEVNTDGDFTYDKESFPEEKDFELFEEAYVHLIEFLKHLLKTIYTNKEYIQERLEQRIQETIQLYVENYTAFVEQANSMDVNGDEDHISMGNQDVYWSITLIDVPRIYSNKEKEDYGYTWDGMISINKALAVYLYKDGVQDIYRLYEDKTEGLVDTEKDIREHSAHFGVEISTPRKRY